MITILWSTQLLMINPHNDDDRTSLTIDVQVIERCGDISLLGVNIDEHLVFIKHISELCKKASRSVGILPRLRNLIPTEAKLLLYRSSNFAIFNILSPYIVWKVERVQERALRIVYNTHSVEYSHLNRANLSSVQNRRLQDLATLMYKVKYGLLLSNCTLQSTNNA